MTPEELEAALREGLRQGNAPLTLIETWGPLDEWIAHHPDAIASVIEAAADLDPALTASERAAVETVGVCLIGGGGGVQADARFRRWIGDPAASVGCMRLLRAARARRREVGLVETERHGVISVYVTPGEEAAKWARLFEGEGDIGQANRRTASAVLVAFAPSRSVRAVERAGAAYGFTALETRLVQAFLDAPSVEAAAEAVGMGREAAKDALAAAARKAGAASAAQLPSRLVALSGPSAAEGGRADSPDLGAVLGLSPTETRVARALASGASAKAAAAELGLSPQTVATYRRSVFAKTGVNRARDLGRLLAEVRGLEQLAAAAEVVFEGDATGRLRALTDPSGRRVAFLDYGPAGAPAVVLIHGSTTGAAAPPPLLASLQARGRRVIIPQRPGFGLTQPGAASDPFASAAADVALILDWLGVTRTDLIARSSGPAFAFALRYPERLGRWMLLNTQGPLAPEARSRNAVYAMGLLLLDKPALIEPFARMLTRQTRSDLVASLMRRAAADVAADRACMNDPETLAFLVRDAQSLMGSGVAGFTAEQRAYAAGWAPPSAVTGTGLTIVRSAGLHRPGEPTAAPPTLPDARSVLLSDAGWFAHFTHAERIAELLMA